MLFQRPADDVLYAALVARDASYEGFAFVCVRTTRIFCRLTCTARNPKPENCQFEESVAACLEKGFRPCKRCRPLEATGAPDPLVTDLLTRLEEQPDRRFYESDLVKLGYDPSTVRRAFKRRFGLSFLEMARLRRLAAAGRRLHAGEKIINAQLEAGYESDSGFRAAIAELFGTAPARIGSDSLLKADWLDTPIGAMLAIADDHALHLLEFADRAALPKEIERIRHQNGCAILPGRNRIIAEIEAELQAYFSGECVGFKTRLAPLGTAFERQVWEALRAIQPGTTQSYAALSENLGKPSAVRAVARANGANPIAIVIPCHRVIGSDGSLTGYGGGLWRKQWLLRHEQRFQSIDQFS
ncbi:trifunctional transcriptional activator/DNA repair protein Ada/methylated-DNA--[protein]-cysteine S-methyltransferase [Allorhizobium sp. BGMRC 0089]|uniref:bifunctional transcriptional activator/DNA repair enzyme AdaA n=1 Tax=Allorhizobium sonneratiae TaxID=2934936 RepID=UPI0020337DB2|nr:trifunctional transcriptional activator/DNA repair protein Ada/methylated-DNA--[protein]-cysteine S-methyltransferase [Allorhizobium sonneratiae]MCM2291977.1 trifunctional transcriptional activator/DNA repair protein Ada/methylated-DNA--[protein]-cysteine S-methyltransferase [Allorhizobium sonneratiae]